MYVYGCPEGHEIEERRPVDDRNTPATCECGERAKRTLTAQVGICVDNVLRVPGYPGGSKLADFEPTKNATTFGPGRTTGVRADVLKG